MDCLQYIRKLKKKNIAVYFDKENINSLDSKREIMLTIMASLAQQENQSLNQNVKLGIQYRYQQGIIQINTNRFLGYTKDENKHLVIVPEEAEIIKHIYREYLEGSSMDKIKKGLENDGILTSTGKKGGIPVQLEKYLEMRSIWAMHFYSKLIPLIFLQKESSK